MKRLAKDKKKRNGSCCRHPQLTHCTMPAMDESTKYPADNNSCKKFVKKKIGSFVCALKAGKTKR